MKLQLKALLSALVIATPIITVLSCGSTQSFSSKYLTGDEKEIEKYVKINPTTEITNPDNTKTSIFTFTLDLSSTDLTQIPENAFYNAESRTYTKAGTGENKNVSVVYNLSKIIFPATLRSIEKRAFFLDPAIYGKQQRKLELDFSKATSLTEIKEQTFKNNQISKLVLPNSLSVIGDEAFANSEIESISFTRPEEEISLSKVGIGAFFNNKLTSLDLERFNKLTTISKAAFKMNQIASVKLPTNLESRLTIAEEVFSQNPIKKEDVIVSDTNKISIHKEAFK